MKGPATWPVALVWGTVRSASAAGICPMCAWNAPTAEASVRVSAWALAMRERDWTLAKSTREIAVRMAITDTTTSSSIRVKPR